MEKPFLNIARHRAREEYTITNFAKDPTFGFFVGWGAPIAVSADEMRAAGVYMVVANLAEFHTRGVDQRQGSDASRLAKIRFNRSHNVVQATLCSESMLRLTALHRAGRGGYVSDPLNSEIVADLPCGADEFYRLLCAAFELAERPKIPVRGPSHRKQDK